MGNEIPKDGVCLQLENGFYAETADGLNFEYYSGDPSGEFFAQESHSSTPDESTLERRTERAYSDYQALQGIFKPRPAVDSKKSAKKFEDAPPVSKGEDTKKLRPEMFEGKTPGEWVWDENGITKSRAWVGPDGSEATETITDDGTGAVTQECDDNRCIFRDERPDYLTEEIESPDGWEPTDVGGMNFETKIVYDGRRDQTGIMARDEYGNVLFVNMDGTTDFLVPGDSSREYDMALMDSPAWKDLLKKFGLT